LQQAQGPESNRGARVGGKPRALDGDSRRVDFELTGMCAVPPKRDRRGQGAQYERNFLSGKPCPVGGELQKLYLEVKFKDDDCRKAFWVMVRSQRLW
jgi:hypothetical protein